MASVLEVGANATAQFGVSTVYHPLGDATLSSSGSQTTESFHAIPRRSAGLFSSLLFNVSANTVPSACTATFRKNFAGGNQSLSIPGATTGTFEDAVNTDSVVAGDKACISLSIPSGSGSITPRVWSVVFAADSNTVKRLTSWNGLAIGTTVNYTCISGGQRSAASFEGTEQFRISTPGTFQNLAVTVAANSASAAGTVNSRLGGVDGSLAVSISAAATGLFEDLTHSDAVISSSLYNYKQVLATGATGTMTVECTSTEFVTTNDASILSGCTTGPVNQSVNTTQYYSSFPNAFTATEANAQYMAQFALTHSSLWLHVNANSVTAASTFNFRKNGANGNQTISIPSSTTGKLQDTTNSDVLAASDLIDYQLVAGATGTAINICDIGAVISQNGTVYTIILNARMCEFNVQRLA